MQTTSQRLQMGSPVGNEEMARNIQERLSQGMSGPAGSLGGFHGAMAAANAHAQAQHQAFLASAKDVMPGGSPFMTPNPDQTQRIGMQAPAQARNIGMEQPNNPPPAMMHAVGAGGVGGFAPQPGPAATEALPRDPYLTASTLSRRNAGIRRQMQVNAFDASRTLGGAINWPHAMPQARIGMQGPALAQNVGVQGGDGAMGMTPAEWAASHRLNGEFDAEALERYRQGQRQNASEAELNQAQLAFLKTQTDNLAKQPPQATTRDKVVGGAMERGEDPTEAGKKFDRATGVTPAGGPGDQIEPLFAKSKGVVPNLSAAYQAAKAAGINLDPNSPSGKAFREQAIKTYGAEIPQQTRMERPGMLARLFPQTGNTLRDYVAPGALFNVARRLGYWTPEQDAERQNELARWWASGQGRPGY
jgi:hypothetical protein